MIVVLLAAQFLGLYTSTAAGEAASQTVFLPLVMTSPGEQIAFLASPGDDWNVKDIFVMYENGSHLQNLTSNPSRIQGFEWSPDGAKIVFASNLTGNYEIYVMNADGSALTQLTIEAAYDALPSWSPDGTRILFVSNREGSPAIYIMNADGSLLNRLTWYTYESTGEPYWSPDGSKIAFGDGPYNQREIYVINVDGSGLTALTNNIYEDYFLEWAPDSSALLFRSNQGQGGLDDRYDIYRMNTDGTNVIRFTESGYCYNATWSPLGDLVAYFDGGISGADQGFYIANADGTGKTPLLCGAQDIQTQDPSWSPDGTHITYSPTSFIYPGGSGIFSVSVDGTSCQHLTDMFAHDPLWRPKP